MSELWTAVAALAAVAAVVTPVLMVLRARMREAKRPAYEKACENFDQLDRMSAAVTRRSFTRSELDDESFDDLLGDLEVVERKTFDGWRTRNAAPVRGLISHAKAMYHAESADDPDWKLKQGVEAGAIQKTLRRARAALYHQWGR